MAYIICNYQYDSKNVRQNGWLKNTVLQNGATINCLWFRYNTGCQQFPTCDA